MPEVLPRRQRIEREVSRTKDHLEVSCHILILLRIGETGRGDGGDAGSMLVPFMGPEGVVVTCIAGPVGVGLVVRRRSVALEDGTDVAVATR